MKEEQLARSESIISYQITDSHFGRVMIASTETGVCHLQYCDNENVALLNLANYFPNVQLINRSDRWQTYAVDALRDNHNHHSNTVRLHIKGTDFQFKVWYALLSVSMGQLTSYGELARQIGNPKACRAVGSAVARNPIAYIIPCHRVVPADGSVGNYLWGRSRKAAIIEWETSKVRTC